MWKLNEGNLLTSGCNKCCIQCDKSKECSNNCHLKHIACSKCYEEHFYIGTHDGGFDD
ncbi:hypothetical protein [Clostridium botulinum]|uniref:hypothetical protein n=1 Tax=Clostridium botulinum TaxID=1491 RepID=UPI000B33F6E1|nr:hypothetical protein [Clostridium botulinum]